MQNLLKFLVKLGLFVSFVASCFIVISIVFFSIWLQTYTVFTQKTPIAELKVSEIKKDEKGEYFEVEYNQYSINNAFTTWILGNEPKINTQQQSLKENFKIYGDQFWIGGPIIKFHDNLILINFKTIYKIGEIGGRYNDLQREKNKTEDMFSIFELNGGYLDWKEIQEDLQKENIKGKIYNMLIDSMQLSSSGKFVTNKSQQYILYITNNGFFLDEK